MGDADCRPAQPDAADHQRGGPAGRPAGGPGRGVPGVLRPHALVVTYDHDDDLLAVAEVIDGQLTATIIGKEDDPVAAPLRDALAPRPAGCCGTAGRPASRSPTPSSTAARTRRRRPHHDIGRHRAIAASCGRSPTRASRRICCLRSSATTATCPRLVDGHRSLNQRAQEATCGTTRDQRGRLPHRGDADPGDHRRGRGHARGRAWPSAGCGSWTTPTTCAPC